MSDMRTYLAAKYMSGPKADAILARAGDAAPKKKKKKVKNEDYIGGAADKGEGSSTGGLLLRDEADEWDRRQGDDLDFEGEDAPVVGKELATFKKSKSQWSTVGSTTLPMAHEPVRDGEVKTEPDGDEDPSPAPAPVMTKRRGGLRTAAQLREEAERQAAERPPSPEAVAGGPDPTTTVHRDSSGRILDVEKLQEEARKREEEEKRKEQEKEEWTKGFTQRKQREQKAREEISMRDKGHARYANDREMNREMKEVERWNDPAAEFVTKKKSKGPRRPKYQGAWAPNRFAIAPGFRWDGVDRSNGFEKKFFQYQNAAARNTYEQNQWSVEDM